MGRIRVAVTGAAGQVGSVLVRRMLELPHIDTIAICRNPINAGIIHSSSLQCNIRIGSITEIDSAMKLLGDVDIIINCALAMINGNPKMSCSLNKAMIESFCRLEKVKLIIHLSSLSVYGGCIDNSKSTFEKPCPDSDYGRSKLQIEEYAKHKFLHRQLNYYILRSGHVYGAKTDRSRQIIDLARKPSFRLPYNGDLLSNSIHVGKLAAKIIALISNPSQSGIYNVADEKQTWRQVFDWHTQTLGLPPVKGISEERSIQLRDTFCSTSIMSDMISWLRSLPILSLIRYPSIFDSIFRVLYIIPPSVTSRFATAYKCLEVGRQISAIVKQDNMRISPVYFSYAMPGKYLKFPSETEVEYPLPEKLSKELNKWYKRYSQPKWLPNSIRE